MPNNAKYCKECGTEVSDKIKFCPDCHSDIPEDAKYCGECGTQVEHDKSKAISALLVFIIMIGAGLVVYRSVDLPVEKLNLNTNQTVAEEEAIKFEEVSFHTMIFRGQVRNSSKINVYTPTTQALMIDYVNQWILKNLATKKIEENHVNEIEVFEKDSTKNFEVLRANVIYVDIDINTDYVFPDGTYSNLGDNLYVSWVSKED